MNLFNEFCGKALREEEKVYLKKLYPDRLGDNVRVLDILGMTEKINHSASRNTYGSDCIIIRNVRRSSQLLQHE